MISFCRGGRSRFRFTDCTSHSIPIPNPSLRKKRRKNIISGTSHYYHLGRVLGFCHNKIYLITPSSLIAGQFSVTPPPLYALVAMTDSPSTALDNHVIPSKILCPRPTPLFPCKKYWLVPYLKSLSWTMLYNQQKWKCCMVLWF